MNAFTQLVLRVQSNGELSKPVLAVLGVSSIVIALVCYLVVSSALPVTAGVAQFCTSLLFLGAMLGFFSVFDALVKLWQGRDVVVDAPPQPPTIV